MTAPLHRVRNYEELDGAQGREVFFRPHRYRASDLTPLRCEVVIDFGVIAHRCALLDVSQNGAALQWPKDVPVSSGDRLKSIAVVFDGHEAYRGEARVGSVRDVDGLAIVGLSFAGLSVAIDDLLHLRTIKTYAQTQRVPSWRVQGYEQFKILVSELALAFEDATAELGRLEASLPWHIIHGEDSPARLELIASIRQGFSRNTLETLEQIDSVFRSIPPAHHDALRDYTRRHLQDFLMQSPVLHRAYHKPFGYPGDYEVMRFLYERPFEGATLFARAISLTVDQFAATRAVRHRKDLIKHRLAALFNERSRPLRVLAIASGPAQEIFELLRDGHRPQCTTEMVLFDQDKEALGHAYRRLRPMVENQPQGRIRVTYLHDSIKRLLRDPDLFGSFDPFDLIYSAGLFDYLRNPTCIQLIRELFRRVVPGGHLLLANMAPESATRWFLDQHCDWHLIYRSRSDLLALAAAADPGGRHQILEEESGINPFVELTKE